VIKKIWDNPHKNPNEAIHDFLIEFYKNRKRIAHKFSGSLLCIDIKNMVKGIIEANKEDFEGITEYTKEKIIACCIDYFVDHYKNQFRDPETDEKNFIKIWQSREIKWLKRIKGNLGHLNKFKIALKGIISTDWKKFDKVWNDFEEQKISSEEFLIIGFLCFEKKKFLEILRGALPLKEVKDAIRGHKKALIKIEKLNAKITTLDSSIESWKAILSFDQIDWTNWYKLGALYLKKGDIESNREAYEKAIECFKKLITPDQAKMYLRNAYWGLAETYEKLGDIETSERHRLRFRQYDNEISVSKHS
jgi:tetratricopeptide (TPR) repeat protein